MTTHAIERVSEDPRWSIYPLRPVSFVLSAIVVFAGSSSAQDSAALATQFGRSPRSFYEAHVNLAENQTDRIERHLNFMVDYLSMAQTSGLTADQRAERQANIKRLARYAETRVFPQNLCRGLTPIFIDREHRACAVGHLMIESGARTLASEISKKQNFAYLGDISVAGTTQWVQSSGLSAIECAMIQPAYAGSFIESFEATSSGDDIVLTWDFGDQIVDFIFVTRSSGPGTEVNINLGGEVREYVDVELPPGDYNYSIYAEESFEVYDTEELVHHHHTWSFLRGDSNGDGAVDGIADTIYTLQYAFNGGSPPPCMEAADTDGNGQLQPLSDALYTLYFAIAAGPPPAFPFPACAPDPDTTTSLGCNIATCP